MTIECYLNFQGNCRQAVAFYSQVFGVPAKVMSYGDAPPDPAFPISEAEKNLVLHAALEIEGNRLMFSDVPPGAPFILGNNVGLTLSSENPQQLTQWFQALSQDGQVEMPLGATFWSSLYGSVIDRFGVAWQVNCADRQCS